MEDFVVAFPRTAVYLMGGMGGIIIGLIGYFGRKQLMRLDSIERLLGREMRATRKWLAWHGERHTRVETILKLDPLPPPPVEDD